MNLSFQNVDAFCASIDLREARPLIDLSRLTFIDPFAVIYLGQFIRYHNRAGRYFDVDMPGERTRVRSYLARIRFWDRFNFSPEMIEQEGLLRFTSTTSLNDIVELASAPYIAEDTAARTAEVLDRELVRVDRDAVLYATAELVDNFVRHAQVDLATLAVQYFPNLHEFAIVVGDSGLGIRATLCQNPKYAHLATYSDQEVILKSLEATVSRTDQAGTGLTSICESVRELEGSLRIASGRGFVFVNRNREAQGEQAYELPGVQVEVRFPER